jgi:cytochrome c-type biogenesis protein CcmH/NrfG
VEANPQSASCLLDLADCYIAAGDKKRAVDAYQKALALETEADAKSSIRSQIESVMRDVVDEVE